MLINTRRVKISRRDAFLVLFGVVWVLFGWYILSLTPAMKALVKEVDLYYGVLPVTAWGVIWVVCGAVAVVCGFWHRFDWVGFAVAIFPPLIWAIFSFLEEFHRPATKPWANGILYLALAGAIWLVAGMADPLDHYRRRRPFRFGHFQAPP